MSDRVGAADALVVRPAALKRRLACMVYEAVLLFGIVTIVGLLYSISTDQRHALHGVLGLQLVVFVVLGSYFAYFWSHGGQTLPMKTWRITVVRADGAPLSGGRAIARYVASWLWFLPALAVAHGAGPRRPALVMVAIAAGMAAYVLLARLRADRQYLHDVLCGTRLIDLQPMSGEPAQSPA